MLFILFVGTPCPLGALLCPQEADYCSWHNLGCLIAGFQLDWAKRKEGLAGNQVAGVGKGEVIISSLLSPYCTPLQGQSLKVAPPLSLSSHWTLTTLLPPLAPQSRGGEWYSTTLFSILPDLVLSLTLTKVDL